jgi:ATP-dependent helicase HrpB
MSVELPIHGIKEAFLEAVGRSPVVVSSPTGSGKSTELPRWCPGRTLVIEPRRIACRSLAARVAELEGSRLGDAVGYVVRDERAVGAATRLIFATPGIVLRDPDMIAAADTVVIDEFHERSLDVDLLLALLLRRRAGRLVVMSATIEGARVAAHLGGVHLAAEGRMFPVEVRYLEQGDALPDASHLPARVARALQEAGKDPGDVLVFLPGRAEIEACRDTLRGAPFAVIPLHGALSLDEQRRAFAPHPARKVILATNVAETSLTLPGVGVVIDSGLVRQTRYHDGRGSLTLGPIAEDSAAQRAGRAGRTAPGVAYRLWSAAARLAPITAPEIHRESLVPLVMAAAAWGARPEDLPLLDPPRPYALDAARADLGAWHALDAKGLLTDEGRALFALPLDAPLARLVAEARRAGCLADAIDLVSALSVGRPLFAPGPAPEDPHDDLRLAGSDVVALVRAVRVGIPDTHRLAPFALAESRRVRARLRRLHGLPEGALDDDTIDLDSLLRAAVAADARSAHVARPRGRELLFSNGGTELELARESAVRSVREPAALVVFDMRSFGAGREVRSLITCASPVTLAWLARAGLGQDRLAAVSLERGAVVAKVERVLAGKALATREESPRGEVARAALRELFLRGSIFKGTLAVVKSRLALAGLAAGVAAREGAGSAPPTPGVEAWVAARLIELGVESGDDLALLSAADLTPPDLPHEVKHSLLRDYPLTVSVGDAVYEADYDLTAHQVILRMVKGSRREPPPPGYLPRFPGLRVMVDGPRGVTLLRARG